MGLAIFGKVCYTCRVTSIRLLINNFYKFINMNKNLLVFLVIVVLAIAFWVYRSSLDEPSLDAPATVSTLSVAADTSSASAISAGAKTVTWQTSNYPKDAGVNINLLRKISDSPKEFTLVRALSTNTANDGQESWAPQSGENTGDLYVEVTCASSYQFNQGCNLSTEPVKVN